jgi:hypothetical protein
VCDLCRCDSAPHINQGSVSSVPSGALQQPFPCTLVLVRPLRLGCA